MRHAYVERPDPPVSVTKLGGRTAQPPGRTPQPPGCATRPTRSNASTPWLCDPTHQVERLNPLVERLNPPGRTAQPPGRTPRPTRSNASTHQVERLDPPGRTAQPPGRTPRPPVERLLYDVSLHAGSLPRTASRGGTVPQRRRSASSIQATHGQGGALLISGRRSPTMPTPRSSRKQTWSRSSQPSQPFTRRPSGMTTNTCAR
jgi:hypothetical protein